MSHELIVIGGVSIVELLIWLPPLWRVRRWLACVVILGLSLPSGLLFGWDITVWTGLILILSAYRIINLLRVIEGRLQPHRLYASTLRTSLWLMSCQALVLAAVWLGSHYGISDGAWLYGAALAQFLTASLLWISTRRHLNAIQPPSPLRGLADKDLPTLSVAIPARNETDDLEACLQSLISSNYPKLEVLVLDDCSQNKRTPGIIRDFAQSGIRFIPGQAPPTHWLAKNYAYHQLAAEANGEVLLFCGVDTRFQPGTLRSMVEVMAQKRKSMVSFIPRNQSPPGASIQPLLVQPARYAWELSLPRWMTTRHPPVLSTCWLITADELKADGGFEAVSRSIAPESYFARQAALRHGGYSFLLSDQTIDLGSAKNLDEQRNTAVRTRYPQLHRRLELVALYGLGELGALLGPFGLAIGAAWGQRWLLAAISLASSFLLVNFYSAVVQLTYRRFLWRGWLVLPLVAIFDIGLLNYSMWRYEFREVIWKGRNVCLPVMMRPTSDSGRTPGR